VTNKGGYIGFSYKPNGNVLENSSFGIGIGKGYTKSDRGNNRIITYISVQF
jgi:hypothetical protein